MSFWGWLGTEEGRGVRWFMILVPLIVLTLYLMTKTGANQPNDGRKTGLDQSIQMIRHCENGEYAGRDDKDQLWLYQPGTVALAKKIDKDALDTICPQSNKIN